MIPKYYKIELTFGLGETGNRIPIPIWLREVAVKYITAQALALFGGYTMYQGQGGWLNRNGRAILEPVRTVVVFSGPILHGEDLEQMEANIDDLVSEIKRHLQQDSVAVVKSEVDLRFR